LRDLIDRASSFRVRDISGVEVWQDDTVTLEVLFDPEHNLEERILKEQFEF